MQDRKYKVNQDRGITSYPFAGSRDHALFVNCDGHGPYGHDVADFVVRAVHAEEEGGEVNALAGRRKSQRDMPAIMYEKAAK